MSLLDLVAPFRKAVVTGIATAVLGYLATVGVQGDMSVNEAVMLLSGSVVNSLLVYITPNRK